MKKLGWIKHGLTALAASGIGLLTGVAQCHAQPPREAEASSVRGNVVRMTTAPKGEIDGAVLDDGTWLHWPPHMEDQFSKVIQVGDRVEAKGRTETGKRGDTHFEVLSVTDVKNNTTVENTDFADGQRPGSRGRGRRGPKAGRAAQDFQLTTVRGVAQRFTTAPEGETDGVILDNGTSLHWPPHLDDRFANIIQKGDALEAVGRTETAPRGEVHFEVQSVTNVRTGTKAVNPDLRGEVTIGAAESRGATSGVSANREQRLRELQEQIDRLQRELERMRAEK